MDPSITHDQLLDYAQGRLAPAEMTRLSRLLLQDPDLQRRYAQLRRLQRLLQEQYRPEPVAHPDARDEAVTTVIASYVEAIRCGVTPATEYSPELVSVPAAESTGSHDGVPSTELAPAALQEVERELAALRRELTALGVKRDGDDETAGSVLPMLAGRSRRSGWRQVASYAAAAAVLVGATAFTFINDFSGDPSDSLPADGLGGPLTIVPPDVPAGLQPRPGTTGDATSMPTIGERLPEEVVSHPEESVVPAPPGATPNDIRVTPEHVGVRPQDTDTQLATDSDGSQPSDVVDGASSPERGSATPGRRPGGVDVSRMPGEAADPEEMVRRVTESEPVRNLIGRGDPSEVVVERPPLRGDLNGDGIVDMADVRLMRRALREGRAFELYGAVADITGSGDVDARDLELLEQLVIESLALEDAPDRDR